MILPILHLHRTYSSSAKPGQTHFVLPMSGQVAQWGVFPVALYGFKGRLWASLFGVPCLFTRFLTLLQANFLPR